MLSQASATMLTCCTDNTHVMLAVTDSAGPVHERMLSAEEGGKMAGIKRLAAFGAGVCLFVSAVTIVLCGAPTRATAGPKADDALRAKVAATLSRLATTLTWVSHLDRAIASTDELLAAQQQLQNARTDVNAIDHVFKTASAGSGVSLDAVRPQLDALNAAQLRTQDELERRGVAPRDIPGYRTPLDWLSYVGPEYFDAYRAAASSFGPYDWTSGTAAMRQPYDDPALRAALAAIRPGHTEDGLREMMTRLSPTVRPAPPVRGLDWGAMPEATAPGTAGL